MQALLKSNSIGDYKFMNKTHVRSVLSTLYDLNFLTLY